MCGCFSFSEHKVPFVFLPRFLPFFSPYSSLTSNGRVSSSQSINNTTHRSCHSFLYLLFLIINIFVNNSQVHVCKYELALLLSRFTIIIITNSWISPNPFLQSIPVHHFLHDSLLLYLFSMSGSPLCVFKFVVFLSVLYQLSLFVLILSRLTLSPREW